MTPVFLDTTNDHGLCPVCSEIIKPGMTECPNCGEKIDLVDDPENKDTFAAGYKDEDQQE